MLPFPCCRERALQQFYCFMAVVLLGELHQRQLHKAVHDGVLLFCVHEGIAAMVELLIQPAQRYWPLNI